MKKQYITFLYSIALAVFILPALTFAQTSLPCNDIIDFNGNREPIQDCNDPFEASDIESVAEFIVNGELIAEGDNVVVPDLNTAVLDLEGNPRNFDFAPVLYRHDGDDYRAVPRVPERFLYFDEYGTYTLVVDDFAIFVSESTLMQEFLDFLIPKAHAQFFPDYTYTLTFTIIPEETVEEIDPLLLQYAPILRMHEDEDYYPMRMEDFVTDSALWEVEIDADDTLVFNESTLTPQVFETFIQNNQRTDDYYLTYSSPENARIIDLDNARNKYGEPDPNDATIYVHRLNDFAGDREFIVLQYWQFYAMNNWREAGELSNGEFTGLNNHEGDFESVFIFLDAETEEPEYVAYSAHHNDGDPSKNLAQYESVRRNWDDVDVIKTNERLVSYVSLGSHANYPDDKARSTGLGSNRDIPSNNGSEIDTAEYLTEFNQIFLDFEGKWGSNQNLEPGADGPRGPKFLNLNLGSVERFLKPIEWAGIDDILTTTFTEAVSFALFEAAQVQMQFTGPVPIGSQIEVAPYEEPINFGIAPGNSTLLPKYWDIESTLLNDSFEVEVTFEYDPEVVATLAGNPENLSVVFYNPDSNVWEPRNSSVNIAENTVSFVSNTFSRYALALLPPVPEPKSIEELFEDLRTVVTDANLNRAQEKRLLLRVKLAEKFVQNRKPVHDRIAKRILKRIERIAERYERRELINNLLKQRINEIVTEIEIRLD